jgi:hypothetical protein
LLHNPSDVKFRFLQKIVDSLNGTENTIFFFVSVNTISRLSRDEQTIFLDYSPNAVSHVVTWFLHKIRRSGGHKNFNSTIWILLNLFTFLLLFNVPKLIDCFVEEL